MLSWNVELMANARVEAFLQDVSIDTEWDVMFLQEFCPPRPEGMQIRGRHLILFGSDGARKCTALVINAKWIPHVGMLSGRAGLAAAELRIPGNRPIF